MLHETQFNILFSLCSNDDEKFTDKIYENIAHHKFKQFWYFIKIKIALLSYEKPPNMLQFHFPVNHIQLNSLTR